MLGIVHCIACKPGDAIRCVSRSLLGFVGTGHYQVHHCKWSQPRVKLKLCFVLVYISTRPLVIGTGQPSRIDADRTSHRGPLNANIGPLWVGNQRLLTRPLERLGPDLVEHDVWLFAACTQFQSVLLNCTFESFTRIYVANFLIAWNLC